MNEHLLLSVASIAVFGIFAHWVAWKLHLPSILLLLIFGFIAGPVTGFLHPDDLLGNLLFPLVSLSVAVILYEGGLTLHVRELPEIGQAVFRLLTGGVIITWLITAVSAHYILSLSWGLSILLGAILIVTGPTVIGPLLQQVRPKSQIAAVLKWEGILIDPVGAVLAVLVFEAILSGGIEQAPGLLLQGVLITIVVGVIIGLLMAGVMIWLLRTFWIPDNLQNAVSLLFVISAFTVSNLLHPEAGLLTVTIMGVVMANQRWVSINHIVEFKENLRVILLAGVFILLAARLQWAYFTQLGVKALLFLAILILTTRPAAIFLSLIGTKFNLREKLFLSWMAPRGIVAAAVVSLFSLRLREEGFIEAERIMAVTFMVIVGTVFLYSLTAKPLAHWLGVAEKSPQGVLIVGANVLGRKIAEVLQANGFQIALIDTNWKNLAEARMENLPTYYGNALAEQIIDEIDLNGIGRLLAVTPNDEANSLACLHFTHIFGRAEVYQLPFPDRLSNKRDERHLPSMHLYGRILFNDALTYNRLTRQLNNGAALKGTPLTEAFDYDSFRAFYQGKAVPLFFITKEKSLHIYAADQLHPNPQPGDILFSLLPNLSSKEAVASNQERVMA